MSPQPTALLNLAFNNLEQFITYYQKTYDVYEVYELRRVTKSLVL